MSKLLIIRCNSYITRGIGRIEFCIDRWICVPRSVSVSFRLILLYVSSGCEEQSLQQKSVSKYQYWWSFVTLELSVPSLLPSESYGKQRVESLFHLSIRCFETTSPLFPPPSFFHDVSMFRLSRARGLRAEGIPISLRFAVRTHEHNGKRRFNASLANNRAESRDFTLHPIRESGRNGSDSIREEFGDHRRAYLSDKGQARILKDASTVTTSSMIPNVMYITPRCTRENR